MKAISYTRHGPAREVLEYGNLATPAPGDGEVLICFAASGVNPSDVKARAGVLWPMTAARTIAHSDGAGVIEAVGAGIDPARLGERVWTYNVNRTTDGLGQGAVGTAAQYGAVRSALALRLPDNVGFNEAAALGVPAMTAHVAVLGDGPVAGKSVVVTGGAGAVGSMAIQIAKWAGAARIVATVSSDAKAALATSDGANECVNYKQAATPDDLVEALLEANGATRYHRLVDVDFGSHINLAARLLHHGSVIATYASIGIPRPSFDFYPLMMNDTTIRMIEIYAQSPQRFATIGAGINEILTAGALAPRIDSVFALAETVDAHERVESGQQLGNVVIAV